MIYYGDSPRKLCDPAPAEEKPEPSRMIFEEPGPAADKHTSTPDAAAAYDRQRSSRDGDLS